MLNNAESQVQMDRSPVTHTYSKLWGFPSQSTYFSELIWAKAQHPHFEVEPQKLRHDTDVAPKAVPPFGLESSLVRRNQRALFKMRPDGIVLRVALVSLVGMGEI